MASEELGPVVIVESVMFDGTRLREALPAAAAVWRLMQDPANGVTVYRRRIVAAGVDLSAWPMGMELGHGR